MVSPFNPFQGLGRIQSYIRWNRFRGKTYQRIRTLLERKYGARYAKQQKEAIERERLTELPARAYNQSTFSRPIEEITLPMGKNKSTTIRITGRVTNSKFKSFGHGISSERNFTFDVPREGTKRQLQKTLREKILDAFFTQYEIANKYRPDFRRRFGNVEVLDIEGL